MLLGDLYNSSLRNESTSHERWQALTPESLAVAVVVVAAVASQKVQEHDGKTNNLGDDGDESGNEGIYSGRDGLSSDEIKRSWWCTLDDTAVDDAGSDAINHGYPR